MSVRKTILAWCAVAAALAATAAPVASAKDGDVRVRGTCTKASSAKLNLSREDGRVEVEFEVDQNRVGVRWGVVLRRNGSIAATRTRVTRAPSGSFTVRILTRDRAGADSFVVQARRAGERCAARASI